MAPIKPVLVVFGISHFCEKARWALDWHGISYTEIGWPPGLHRALLKQHGAKGSSLPVVLDGDLVVEGSGAIIDWAESKAQDRTRSLNPQTGDLAETREIERRADEVVGFHVRRLAYAETLPYYSHLVRPTLFLRCTAWHRLIGGVMWPVTRRIMMQMYDIRPVRQWPWGEGVIKHKTAIFRQINRNIPVTHHDALEFPDGQIVLLTLLKKHQRATVLQLPAVVAGAKVSRRVAYVREQKEASISTD